MVKRPGKPATSTADLDAVFGALGSDVRRTLLDRLAAGPLAVADLAAAVPVSWPAVSKHLRVLEEAGLVVRAREGRTHRIARQEAPLTEAMAWLTAQEGPGSAVPVAAAQPPRPAMLGPARALVDALAPAARVVARALAPAADPTGDGPADYLAFVLRRRLGTGGLQAGELADLRADLVAGLASFEALRAALAAGSPADASLEALTAGASRLTWLLGQHPRLADLGLLGRPSAAA